MVAVISPKTEAYDRGGKFSFYRQLKTLKEYVLVGSEAKTVEVFRRDDAGSWIFFSHSEGAQIELASVDLTIPMDAFYEDVVLGAVDGGM